MRRSWSPATALRTVWVPRFSCAACLGWGSCPTMSSRRHRSRWLACRSGCGSRSVPDDVVSAPPVAVARLSERLRIPTDAKSPASLNKGENLRALRRDLFYASEGAIRHHNPEQQTEQAWCLTIATNAIVTWISEYYGRAIAEMRAGGHLIQDEVLAHLWPTHHDNVNFFGTITVEIDGELAKLDTDGYRPPLPHPSHRVHRQLN